MLPRRSVLGLASSLAAAALAACAPRRSALPETSSAQATGDARWTSLRGTFPLAKDRVHLASLLLASNPAPVREAVDRFRAALDADPVGVLEHDFTSGEYTNATLDAAARYIGGSRDEIALTDSTTSGIALVYGGLRLGAGDEVLTTKHDHWVTHESLRLAAERTGAEIRTVPLYDEGAEAKTDRMVRAIQEALTPATRAVAITWVHSSTGVKTPVRAIADAIAKANATRGPADKILLCVDGVHGFGIENASMSDLGCDFFMAGCHKWIFGPRGTGIVWGRRDAWQRLAPQACPFHLEYVMTREYGGAVPKPNGAIMTPGGFRAFEHRWALRAAFELHLGLGKANVESRIHELSTRCKAGLAAIPRVTVHTPRDTTLSSGIVCFEVQGREPDAVVARLLKAGIIASTTPYQPSYVRFSPALVNTPEEIDRAIAAVRALA
jgi:selenocysteine lyase/cysteine desulfurase